MPHVPHHTTTPRQTPKQSQPTKQQKPILSCVSCVLMFPPPPPPTHKHQHPHHNPEQAMPHIGTPNLTTVSSTLLSQVSPHISNHLSYPMYLVPPNPQNPDQKHHTYTPNNHQKPRRNAQRATCPENARKLGCANAVFRTL